MKDILVAVLLGVLVGLFIFTVMGGLEMTLRLAFGFDFDNNTTIDCIRMFYSDEWNKGYVTDLAKFCGSLKK